LRYFFLPFSLVVCDIFVFYILSLFTFFSKILKNQIMSKVIVIGGGLAGLSAAHTILENGGSVLLLDKSAFLGGNSTKATSGINGISVSLFLFL